MDPSEYNISLNWNACDWLPCDDDNSVLLMQTSHRVRFDLQKFGYATVKARAQSRTPPHQGLQKCASETNRTLSSDTLQLGK